MIIWKMVMGGVGGGGDMGRIVSAVGGL
jgi:hypothetical protein